MPIIKHLHTYERSRDNKEVYRCVDPLCTHYTRKALLIGKMSLCYKCRTEFILDLQQLRNKRPVCILCSKSPKSKERKQALEIMEGILSE